MRPLPKYLILEFCAFGSVVVALLLLVAVVARASSHGPLWPALITPVDAGRVVSMMGRVETTTVTLYREDGTTPIYREDGTTPITIALEVQ